MKCAHCNSENTDSMHFCSNCGKPLIFEPPPLQHSIPRNLPPNIDPPQSTFHVCVQCGYVFPETTFQCTTCGADIRQREKRTSSRSAKGCFVLLLKRLLAMGVASAISFLVGWVSVFLGFGEFLAKVFTTLVSTLISFIPVLIGWIKNRSSTGRIAMISVLLIITLFGPTMQSVGAQSTTPEDILQLLLNQINASSVEWESDQDSLETTVYFKSAANNGNYTNAAQVVNLEDSFGSTGGQVWLDSYLEILNKPENGCSVQPHSLNDARAYFYECSKETSYQSGIIWESGAWAAAVYNFVYPVGDYSVEYLADQLYPLLPSDQNSNVTPSEESPSLPSGQWNQDDINRMAIQVLDGYAEAKGWSVNSPCTSYFDCNDPQNMGVLVYEQRNTELVERGLTGDPFLQSIIQSGEASYYRRPVMTDYPVQKGSVYNHISILYYPDQEALNQRLTDILQDVDLDPGYDSYVSPQTIVLQNDGRIFHGQDAVLQRLVVQITIPGQASEYLERSEVFAWVNYPWFFSIVGNLPNGGESQTIDTPLFDVENDPELLYLLAAQAGMFNQPTTVLPNATEDLGEVEFTAPSPQVSFTEDEIADMNEDELSALMATLAPSALLPALGVAGLSLLLDLLRRKPNTPVPSGTALSPFPGLGRVSAEVAAYHTSLIQQGYSFNLATGKLTPPVFKSPFDGRSISKQQYEKELGLKSQGFILSGENFVLPESFNRNQRWEEGQQKSYEGSIPTREKLLQQEQQKALEEQQRKERIDYLRSAIPQMEEQAEIDFRSSQMLQQDTIGTIWKASQMTARTVATGVDSDGNMSWLSMGGRMLAAGASAGASEVVLNAADFGYRTYDNVQSGMSIPGAAITSLAWMSIETGVFKVGGKILKWTAGSKPAVWAGDQVRTGLSSLTDSCQPFKESVLDPALDQARASINKVFGSNQVGQVSEDQIRALYQNNGRSTLRQLEANGQLTASEARTISQVISRDVNKAVTEGTPDAIRNFENQFGVRVKTVTVADSGSSSARSLAARSVNSDFDRSIMVEFDQTSLDRYTNQLIERNPSLSQVQAREMAQNELQSQFTTLHQNQMDNQFSKIGLTTQDIDYKNYNGLSGDPKMGDSYPAGYNRTRMANQGEALVFRQNSSGEIVTAKMTGQQVVDQEALSKINVAEAQGQQAADIINSQQPIITQGDALKVLAQQNQVAASSTDPLKLAKALLRVDKAQHILSGIPGAPPNGLPKIPESILHIAEELIKNPQRPVNQLPTNFTVAAAEQIKNLFNIVNH